MADYKDIIKGTLNNLAGKVKEVAESGTVPDLKFGRLSDMNDLL